MTRFVFTGKPTGSLSMLNEDVVLSGKLEEKLKILNLEVEKIESHGDEVTYYLKESKGPKLLCD